MSDTDRAQYMQDYLRAYQQRPGVRAKKYQHLKIYRMRPEVRARSVVASRKYREGLSEEKKLARKAHEKAYKGSQTGRRVQAEAVLRKAYGVGFEDWARMYEAQCGKCGGCRCPLTFDRTTHVDHCHVTGTVRGLLCSGCNTALGQAGENPETLRGLAAYIERVR